MKKASLLIKGNLHLKQKKLSSARQKDFLINLERLEKNNLIYIDAVVVNKNTKSENTISSIRIMIN